MSYDPKIIILFILVLISSPEYSLAQYFGKNKVEYENPNFKIYETPHFDIYNYLDNDHERNKLGELSERWYKRHQAIFRDSLPERNPIIIYNNQADFKQKTVVQQRVSVGLGGVTGGLRRRITMPLTMSNIESSHVLGHEIACLSVSHDTICKRGEPKEYE